MEPIRYVDLLIERYSAAGFPPYEWSVNDDAPLTALEKPLSQCTVTMLTSGGVSKIGMPGFDPKARNDFRLDAIEMTADSRHFVINDSYYNHEDADRDINCIFAIDRLREMAARGEIGGVAPRLWSGFMGRIYKRREVIEQAAPDFARKLKEDGVDILVAVPA